LEFGYLGSLTLPEFLWGKYRKVLLLLGVHIPLRSSTYNCAGQGLKKNELYLLGYNTVYSVESQPVEQWFLPVSRWFLACLIFFPEDGGGIFFRNVG
jgi:hypothetical protein